VAVSAVGDGLEVGTVEGAELGDGLEVGTVEGAELGDIGGGVLGTSEGYKDGMLDGASRDGAVLGRVEGEASSGDVAFKAGTGAAVVGADDGFCVGP
jgi:hypothetical protein